MVSKIVETQGREWRDRDYSYENKRQETFTNDTETDAWDFTFTLYVAVESKVIKSR